MNMVYDIKVDMSSYSLESRELLLGVALNAGYNFYNVYDDCYTINEFITRPRYYFVNTMEGEKITHWNDDEKVFNADESKLFSFEEALKFLGYGKLKYCNNCGEALTS